MSQVNGVNTKGLRHSEVVALIRSRGDEVSLLVVDQETDELFRRLGITPTITHTKGQPNPPALTRNSTETMLNSACFHVYRGLRGWKTCRKHPADPVPDHWAPRVGRACHKRHSDRLWHRQHVSETPSQRQLGVSLLQELHHPVRGQQLRHELPGEWRMKRETRQWPSVWSESWLVCTDSRFLKMTTAAFQTPSWRTACAWVPLLLRRDKRSSPPATRRERPLWTGAGSRSSSATFEPRNFNEPALFIPKTNSSIFYTCGQKYK